MRKCIILALSAFVIACKEAPKPMQQGAKELPVIRVGAQSSTNQLAYPVNIEGTINSPVQARVSGYITQVLVDEGAKVSKGQPLFRLETQALSQSAQAAKSAVDAAQVEVSRLEPLVAKNIVSHVQLETAKANLSRAKASYAEVNANLDYAIVRAPVNGVVGSINLREGALVSANSTTLTTVSDVKQVYAYFSMNEKEYLSFLGNAKGGSLSEKISNLPEVTLRMANGQLYDLKGKIQAVTGQIDKTTGSIQFRATFDNPNGLLTNGNSGTILLPETHTNTLVIPEVATYEMQGVIFAFKVENDTLKQVILTLKNRSNNLAVVESGLENGDLLLVQGLNTARSGMVIKPKEVSMDSIVQAIKPIFR
ncbi:efflux RND transporter periplasmic adaptor subunit [Capnocytophaga catalasegens]|uniref:RND transporter n=1 Tax=Capnocytophaga catalasegens TaxID=1004260 RepID=A0AAV5AT26_9FLAO|nr:efflux RND transporter periplasmic adaptor subunit [Capnocytophaga catalasegens]GIZ15970.1 RND transporter [Capnocytophaga catalasegens]GJM50457.1 RND transporter [Capnocytophaga catalasegens]GJM53952.1 RND transporter [Capnocytophaga catalasegens]